VYNTLGKLELKKQDKKVTRAMKIIGKKILAKGKVQLNLFTGKNIILDKKADYSVGDSVVVDKEKVTKHLKFEKGAKVFLTSGKHIGHNGVIEEITETESWLQSKKILVKTKNGTFETSKECAYVLDGEL
jgi:ribosomal protein S4E